MPELTTTNVTTGTLDSWFWRKFPYARDDTAETDEDSTVNVDVLDNDLYATTVFAIDGKKVEVGDSVTHESGATITLNADYSFDVDPSTSEKLDALNDGEMGEISFKYSVYGPSFGSWGHGKFGSDEATVTVTVNGITDDGEPVNHAPVAHNDIKFVSPYPYPYPYPYPGPYPIPLDSAQSTASLDGVAAAASLDGTSADYPIVTTLAIGEEGDPDPYPSVTIDVLDNDFDPDLNPLSIARINGQDVSEGKQCH